MILITIPNVNATDGKLAKSGSELCHQSVEAVKKGRAATDSMDRNPFTVWPPQSLQLSLQISSQPQIQALWLRKPGANTKMPKVPAVCRLDTRTGWRAYGGCAGGRTALGPQR